MADFGQGEYKQVRLRLKKSDSNNIIDIQEECFIDLGLKGTRANQSKPLQPPPLVHSKTMHSSGKSDNGGGHKGLKDFGNLGRDNFDKISLSSASVSAATQELERLKRDAGKQ